MGKLTVKGIENLTKHGRYGDGGGLYLYIAPGGSKSWVLRLRLNGKQTDKGLGSYKKLSLTKARQLADTYRVSIANGGNPWGDSPAPRPEPVRSEPVPTRPAMPTFGEVTHKVHVAKIERWRA